MTPTGSCPMTSPERTGYSPRRMWTSVPQMVVSVTRMTASPTRAVGRGTSRTSSVPGDTNTVARIVVGEFAVMGIGDAADDTSADGIQLPTAYLTPCSMSAILAGGTDAKLLADLRVNL